MKKETIIAILMGVVFGTIIAVVIVSKNKEKQLETTKTIAPTIKLESKATANNKQIQSLEIIQPTDGLVVNKNTITIEGKSYINSLIIIQSPIKDLAMVNTKEIFKTEFPLASGENVIRIFIYPKDKQIQSQEKEIKIYYLDEQL